MSAERLVMEAMRIENFLKDDVIDAAIKRVAAKYYEEFRKADSSEKRVTSWAKANALEDFLTELQATKDKGEVEVLKAAARAPKLKE